MKYATIVSLKILLILSMVVISSCDRDNSTEEKSASLRLKPTLATLSHKASEKFIGHKGIKTLCEQHLGMRYLLLPEIKTAALKGKSENDLIYPSIYISQDVDLNDKVTKSHIADMYVKYISDEMGYGVFANSDIKQGDLVGEYAGIIDDKSNTTDTTWAWSYPSKEYKKELELPSIVIDGKMAGNVLRFVNHSDDPNTVVKRIFLQGYFRTLYMATKDIKANEQVTVNYGADYWASRSKRSL